MTDDEKLLARAMWACLKSASDDRISKQAVITTMQEGLRRLYPGVADVTSLRERLEVRP